MAISTFAELRTAITDRLGARSDFSATQLKECVWLCDARLQRELRATDMETKNASFSINAQYVNLPTGFLEARAFYIPTGGQYYTLEHSTPERIILDFGTTTARPRAYAVVGSQFMFGPTPDATYTATLVYHAKFTALSGDTDTNFIITDHPDLYLNGSLYYAYLRLQNFEMANAYEQMFVRDLESLKSMNARRRWGGPALAVRVA